MKARKKPILVGVYKTPDKMSESTIIDIYEVPAWVRQAWHKDIIRFNWDEIRVETLEGPIDYPYGYVLIRGVDGEIYGCDPDIFEKTYEIVE